MLSTLDIGIRLTASLATGIAVGINRDMHAKLVGVRTLGLVGLGSALVTLEGSGFTSSGMDPNTSRAVQGLSPGSASSAPASSSRAKDAQASTV